MSPEPLRERRLPLGTSPDLSSTSDDGVAAADAAGARRRRPSSSTEAGLRPHERCDMAPAMASPALLGMEAQDVDRALDRRDGPLQLRRAQARLTEEARDTEHAVPQKDARDVARPS